MNLDMVATVVGEGVDPLTWLPYLQAACEEFGIADQAAQSAFLANAAHESDGFTAFEENLDYKWTALMAQWPRRFDLQTALRVGRVQKDVVTQGSQTGVIYQGQFVPCSRHAADQQAIANIAYGNRYGNVHEGDGWRFRGRGCFQLTFHDNYLAYSQAVHAPEVMDNPDLVSTSVEHIVRSAAHYWFTKGLNQVLAQRGFEAVCVAVNGGRIGLEERVAYFQKLQTFA